MTRTWKFGCLVALAAVFGLVSLGMIVSAISSLLGSSRTITFSCDRNAGTCLLRSGADHTLKLAEIRDVEVKSAYSSHELQWSLVAHLRDAPDLTLADPSGSRTSADEYRRAATEIHSFLSGTAPTLETRYGVRLGITTIVDDLFYGIFGILMFVVGPILWHLKIRRFAAAGRMPSGADRITRLDAAKRAAILKEENVPTWAFAQEAEIPSWAKAQDIHRRGQITPEQAGEIDRRLKVTTHLARFFSVFWGVLGAGMLITAVFLTKAAPALIVAGVISLTFAMTLQLIIRVRFRGVKSGLRAGEVEALKGVVTGSFAFYWRNPGLDVLVSIDHRGFKMLAPSLDECYALVHSLQNLAAQKTPIIAYLLPKTRMLVAIEAAPPHS